jgi:hypothetical protein
VGSFDTKISNSVRKHREQKVFNRAANLKQILIIQLAYPAVLGSIFYSVLSNISGFDFTVKDFPPLVMMICVVVFYSIDYLFAYVHSKYSYGKLLTDLIVILLMFFAFRAINIFIGAEDYRTFYLCMAATLLVFIVWDVGQFQWRSLSFWIILPFELIVFSGFAHAYMKELSPELGAVISAAGACVMIGVFNFFARRHL